MLRRLKNAKLLVKEAITINRLFGVIFLLLSVDTVTAKQLIFEKKHQGRSTQFNYQWLDADNKKQSFSFNIANARLNGDFRHFKALRPSLLQMHSLRKLKTAASKIDPRKGQVILQPTYDGIEFTVSGTDPIWIETQSAKLQTLYQQSLTEYLHQEYYIEFDSFHSQQEGNQISYKPDHKRFVKESGKTLESVAKALTDKFPRANARTIATFLLSWIQSIPYNRLESRKTSNGSGFSPPNRLLANNQGDCDSKVVLMAALMREIFPRLRIAIIYIPEHALIGFNISHIQGDEIIDIDGLDYSLAEPTGPAILPIAEIAEQSKRYIDSNIYQYEIF